MPPNVLHVFVEMWSCQNSSDVSIVLFNVLPTLSVLLGLHVTVRAFMNIS